jgi:hypothetical protein
MLTCSGLTVNVELVPSPLMRLAIFARGLRLSERVSALFKGVIKEPLRTRAGAAGGLDLVLDDGSWVNAPVLERFCSRSPYLLDVHEERFVITNGSAIYQYVSLPPRPAYYDSLTTAGTTMSRVGIMQGDRLTMSLTNFCVFWGTDDVCQYCSIGLNRSNDEFYKSVTDVVETSVAATREGVANHIAINAGGLPGDDRGALLYARYARSLRERIGVPIAAQLLPPKDLDFVNHLKDGGYSEVTYDVEIFDWDANSLTSPGKAAIGLSHYVATLKRAVEVFGVGNVSSNLIAGLESAQSAARGVSLFASLGVVPKLIVFRPLEGTPLSEHAPPAVTELIHIYQQCHEAAAEHGMYLGPKCNECNVNRLAFTNYVDFGALFESCPIGFRQIEQI